MIFAALCFIVIGALAGLVFGGLEGHEVVARRSTGGKKLPHAWLLLARVFVCLFIAVAIEGWTQLSLIGARSFGVPQDDPLRETNVNQK